ncbi:uncharacterized protein Pyn_35793 [Prunus yedoensis var. nudiflora]|uniref:Pentatricopeptide repeat-containing protein n=1 Tax=Prunus yedoensis var. nudiflora TaxID=2094558 RepID=A0A314UAS3_PRUYE|nr:uncharacterized protein Pyn_35793 [Prunus yedoensis var. nudiflora]
MAGRRGRREAARAPRFHQVAPRVSSLQPCSADFRVESDEMKHDLHPGDIAVRLDLISKSMGLKKPRATLDVNRMEKLLMKMETDPLVTLDWHGYAAAADAFLKAGQLERQRNC